MKKQLANIITSSRIIGSIILLFLDINSPAFMYIYIWCGISDSLDGIVARRLKISSSLGSKLDTISDLTFYTVLLIKIRPVLNELLPPSFWYLVYAVLIIRLLIYIYVLSRYKRLLSRHTIFNKITSGLMFFLFFTLKSDYFIYYAWLIIIVAYVAAVDEIIYLIRYQD